MQRAIFEPRITEVKGRLAVVVNARNKWKQADVLRIFEDGKTECRNLYFYPIGGYMVDFKDSRLDRWSGAIKDCNGVWSLPYQVTEEEKELLVRHYPEFRYTLAKAPPMSIYETWQALQIWKKFPQIENLLAVGYKRLALTQGIYKLSKKQTKMVLDFIRKYPEEKKSTITKIRTCTKYNMTPEDFDIYWECWNTCDNRNIEEIRYFMTQERPVEVCRVYHYDYRPACQTLGKNWEDPYWRFPKDFWKIHNRVMAQMDNIRKTEEREQLQKLQAVYTSKVQKFMKKDLRQGEFKVYVPQKVTQISKQARELNQCLVTCNYTEKVNEGECLLVFVSRKGKPSSTAEILPSGRIGQFYGNEKATNIFPSDEERKLVDMWVNKFYKTRKQRKVA